MIGVFQTPVVDQFVLELFHNVVVAFRRANADDPASGTIQVARFESLLHSVLGTRHSIGLSTTSRRLLCSTSKLSIANRPPVIEFPLPVASDPFLFEGHRRLHADLNDFLEWLYPVSWFPSSGNLHPATPSPPDGHGPRNSPETCRYVSYQSWPPSSSFFS